MISWPYTKLLNSNNMVDQGAVVILTSVEKATYLQIPSERWVFPWTGTDAHDTYSVAERCELPPLTRRSGSGRASALELAGLGIDDIDLVDIYSCFPSAVQVAAAEIGLSTRRPRAAADGHGRADLRGRSVEQLRHALHRDHGREAGARPRAPAA